MLAHLCMRSAIVEIKYRWHPLSLMKYYAHVRSLNFVLLVDMVPYLPVIYNMGKKLIRIQLTLFIYAWPAFLAALALLFALSFTALNCYSLNSMRYFLLFFACVCAASGYKGAVYEHSGDAIPGDDVRNRSAALSRMRSNLEVLEQQAKIARDRVFYFIFYRFSIFITNNQTYSTEFSFEIIREISCFRLILA